MCVVEPKEPVGDLGVVLVKLVELAQLREDQNVEVDALNGPVLLLEVGHVAQGRIRAEFRV